MHWPPETHSKQLYQRCPCSSREPQGNCTFNTRRSDNAMFLGLGFKEWLGKRLEWAEIPFYLAPLVLSRLINIMMMRRKRFEKNIPGAHGRNQVHCDVSSARSIDRDDGLHMLQIVDLSVRSNTTVCLELQNQVSVARNLAENSLFFFLRLVIFSNTLCTSKIKNDIIPRVKIYT